MGRKYWLEREHSAIGMAYSATTVVARRIHLEIAERLGKKAATFRAVRKVPTACLRLVEPFAKALPFIKRRGPVNRPSILLCDGDVLALEVLEHHFSRAGFDVVCATDGNDAIAALEACAFDAVVLAIMIPGPDGIAVLRIIRGNPAWSEVPVMMLTLRDSEDDIVGALQLGASDYLTKPFLIGEVLERVNALISRPGLTAEGRDAA